MGLTLEDTPPKATKGSAGVSSAQRPLSPHDGAGNCASGMRSISPPFSTGVLKCISFGIGASSSGTAHTLVRRSSFPTLNHTGLEPGNFDFENGFGTSKSRDLPSPEPLNCGMSLNSNRGGAGAGDFGKTSWPKKVRWPKAGTPTSPTSRSSAEVRMTSSCGNLTRFRPGPHTPVVVEFEPARQDSGD